MFVKNEEIYKDIYWSLNLTQVRFIQWDSNDRQGNTLVDGWIKSVKLYLFRGCRNSNMRKVSVTGTVYFMTKETDFLTKTLYLTYDTCTVNQ